MKILRKIIFLFACLLSHFANSQDSESDLINWVKRTGTIFKNEIKVKVDSFCYSKNILVLIVKN